MGQVLNNIECGCFPTEGTKVQDAKNQYTIEQREGLSVVASTDTDHPSTKTVIGALPESEALPILPHAVQSFETNVKSTRVKQLSHILDPLELEQSLLKQYESDEEEEEASESEDMDEAELEEIERRKTESLATYRRQGSTPLAVGSQLYRDDSVADRNIDIDALREDMEHQLLALKTGTPAEAGEEEMTVGLKKLENGTKHPENSHLFRNHSAYKWDTKDLKHQKEEMQKQMMHLLIKSNKST
eukprot:127340_1